MNAFEAIKKGKELVEKYPVSMIITNRILGRNAEDLEHVIDSLPPKVREMAMLETLCGALDEIMKYFGEVSEIPLDEMEKVGKLFEENPEEVLNHEELPRSIEDFISGLEN